MSTESERPVGQVPPTSSASVPPLAGRLLEQEFRHLRSSWWCFWLLGVFLIVCGMTALVYPVVTSVAVIGVLGVVLMVAGLATVIAAFWAGKWSGFLLELLVGILYLAAGLVVREHPLINVLVMALFFAVSFIVVGSFRILMRW